MAKSSTGNFGGGGATQPTTSSLEIIEMSVNYIAEGKRLEFEATSAITAGDVVTFGTVVGVCTRDFAVGELATAAIEGIFRFPCQSGDEFVQGDACEWQGTRIEERDTGTSVGCVTKDSGTGETEVEVLLIPYRIA